MIVLNLVLIGLVITLEPLPLTAFILILSSKGGVRKGAAFIFGWLLSLAIVIAFTVLVTGNNPPKPSTAPSLAALAAKLAIGVGLTVIAIRQYKKMGKPKPPKKPPRWQTGIDNMTPWYAIGLGPLTQPWALIAAGVSVIVEAKLSSWPSSCPWSWASGWSGTAFTTSSPSSGPPPVPANRAATHHSSQSAPWSSPGPPARPS